MSSSGSKTVIIAALIGNALIAVAKFVGAAITGSSAMLSEGIHSLVDTGNQVLLLYGLKQAAKPADEEFPFGHGKEIYFWSFVVAILIFALGSGISIYEGISHLKHPEPITSPIINYVILGLAILFEGTVFRIALKEFNSLRGDRGYFEAVKEGKDSALFVVLFEDSAALLGLFVAIIGIALSQITGILQFDGIASIIIGLILGSTAVWLAIETKGLLIGEAARPEIVKGIRAIANSFDEIQHVNEVLTMHMGPEYILVAVSAEFDNGLDADSMEETNEKLDQLIRKEFPDIKRIFIEAEARNIKHSKALG